MQVSMITFKTLPAHAARIALISSKITSYFFSFRSPMLMTMSISSAPFCTASVVSNTFTSFVLYPFGKPITVQIATRPAAYAAPAFTNDGGMQTDAVPFAIASSISA